MARARDAGDLWNQALLLLRIVDLDLRAGRTGDAAAHLREGLQIAVRTGSWLELRNGLYQCTVGSHLDRIRDKTGCRRRADLTRLALAAGLV